MDAELIDLTRDRVWAVAVIVSYTDYVVAETAREAERIAKDAAGDVEPEFSARELTEPLEEQTRFADSVPYGRTTFEGRELTVNDAVALIASHKPAFDTETVLMPFADSPPPLHPAQIEDYLGNSDASGIGNRLTSEGAVSAPLLREDGR
jgi:hypothetical protein